MRRKRNRKEEELGQQSESKRALTVLSPNEENLDQMPIWSMLNPGQIWLMFCCNWPIQICRALTVVLLMEVQIPSFSCLDSTYFFQDWPLEHVAL